MFGSTSFGNGPQTYINKQEDIKFEEPLKWGDTSIIGIPCDWERTGFLANYFLMQRTAESKLIKGIFTNNLSLVRQGVEDGARITQPIKVITTDAPITVKDFFVPEAKKFSNADIVNYLRKVFNDACLREYRSAHINGFGPSQLRVRRSEVETVMMFDGLQPLPVKEEDVEKMDLPLSFGDNKIIGFVKGNGLDRSICTTFITGVLTGNFEMVKKAVDSGKIILANTIPVVTSDMIQINFDPIAESKNTGDPVITDYLLSVNEQQQQDMMRRMGFGVR